MNVDSTIWTPQTTLLEVAIKGGFTFDELTDILSLAMMQSKRNPTESIEEQKYRALYLRISNILGELNYTFYSSKIYVILTEAIWISYKDISNMMYSLIGETYPIAVKNCRITQLSYEFYEKVIEALANKFDESEDEIASCLRSACRFIWAKNSDDVLIKYFHRRHSHEPPAPRRSGLKAIYPTLPPDCPNGRMLIGRIVSHLLLEDAKNI